MFEGAMSRDLCKAHRLESGAIIARTSVAEPVSTAQDGNHAKNTASIIFGSPR